MEFGNLICRKVKISTNIITDCKMKEVSKYQSCKSYPLRVIYVRPLSTMKLVAYHLSHRVTKFRSPCSVSISHITYPQQEYNHHCISPGFWIEFSHKTATLATPICWAPENFVGVVVVSFGWCWWLPDCLTSCFHEFLSDWLELFLVLQLWLLLLLLLL